MMIKKLSRAVIVGALFIWSMTGPSYADVAKGAITIAIFPCTDVVMSFKKFHPLMAYLEEETGFDIRLVVPTDPAEFERAIKNGHLDFAFQDPYTYVRLADLYDKDALIRGLTQEGTTEQSGVVIARKDANINKFEDLKGKTVMFGPKLSAARWVAAKSLFEERGIDIDKDLKSYSNGRCCEDIAFGVYLKAVDAGVVCDHFLGEHPEKQRELGLDPNQIIVIGRTKLVPTRVFAARRTTNDDLVAKVNQALLALDNNKPTHRKILHRAELGGFQKSKDADYDDMRILNGLKASE
jgi:phosphonate transport system substrate-binding protein